MKTKTKYIRTRFDPETRFELAASPGPVPRAEIETQFDRLKTLVLLRLLATAPGDSLRLHVQRAVNEAEALAWTTAYPLLLLPVLAEEKARTARLQAARQEEILQRSHALMADAA